MTNLFCLVLLSALVGLSLCKDSIFRDLLKNYDKLQSPHGEDATVVEIGIYINSFYGINEQTMDYTVNIYLRQRWTDPRLKFSSPNNRDDYFIKLPDGAWDKIWVPDVFFRNEKSGKYHDVTTSNRLLRLYSDGKLWYAVKLTVTLSCQMQLQKYPFDTQICPMKIESFSYTMDTIILKWLPDEIKKEPNLQLPQFSMIDMDSMDCSQNYTSGAYPCLQLNFFLKRDFGYFVLQVVAPSILLVMLSWFSFWLKTDSVTARVLIGLLVALTISTQSTGVHSSLPKVSYVKAIDVWMMICMLFVFFALFETALVSFLSSRNGEGKSDGNSFELVSEEKKEESKQPLQKGKSGPIAGKVDFFCRILFPICFLLFIIIYFALYS